MDLNELRQSKLVYSVPGMERAKVTRDLVYKTAEGKPLKLDLYYPPDASEGGPLPAVILVHGEWPPEIIDHSKDLGMFVGWGQVLAASGLVAVNFNHRATERLTRMHDAGSDVADLIAYVRENASSFDIDPERLCAWVFSAGMPIGVWAGLRGAREGVRCVVCYYGVMDLMSLREQLPTDLPEADLREFSALEYIRSHSQDVPHIFIAKAGHDRPALNATIDLFVEEARKLGVPVEMMEHEQGEHGFDVFNDDDRSREIIVRTLKFIEEHI